MEWIRYGLYHKDRATTIDASPDQGDLFTVIHGLFRPRSKVARCLPSCTSL